MRYAPSGDAGNWTNSEKGASCHLASSVLRQSLSNSARFSPQALLALSWWSDAFHDIIARRSVSEAVKISASLLGKVISTWRCPHLVEYFVAKKLSLFAITVDAKSVLCASGS